MFPVHDPVESIVNSLQAVESGFRRAAKDLESQWSASWNGAGQLHFFCGGIHVQEAERRPPKKRLSRDVSLVAEEAGRKWSPAVLYVPMKSILGGVGRRGDSPKRVHDGGDAKEDGASCAGCLHFAAAWSLLVNSFVQAFPSPFKSSKKRLQKHVTQEHTLSAPMSADDKTKGASTRCNVEIRCNPRADQPKEGGIPSLELFVCYLFESLGQNLQFFDQSARDGDSKSSEPSASSSPTPQFDHLKIMAGIVKGKTPNVDAFLSNMRFARVGGPPATLVGVASPEKDEGEDGASTSSKEEPDSNSAQKLASGLLNIPLSNVERLRSTLSTVSLAELVEYVPQLGRPSQEHPDKKKLFSVQDFFRYTESEGKLCHPGHHFFTFTRT